MTRAEETLVQEEFFENQRTDIEAENEDSTESTNEPWNPDQIRVTTKSFSVRNILDMITEEELELAPDFQRQRVWQNPQKSRLIESLLLQIPLPAFYFSEGADGSKRVVDGLQRLSTIQAFVRGDEHEQFSLTDLEYLRTEAGGKTFPELSAQWKRRINNTQITAHVIDPTTPPQVTYDIFRRINTGGSPLKPQEIRHCMSSKRSRDFLRECIDVPEFHQATGGSMRNHIRMEDRELALRFCAFKIFGVDGYEEPGRRLMDTFLMEATEKIDNPREVSDAELENLKEHFRTAMTNSYAVFGDYAFRKWDKNTTTRNPINKPLFESWSVTLADLDTSYVRDNAPKIVDSARNLMTDDSRYMDSISSGTGDPRKVAYRFDRARATVNKS